MEHWTTDILENQKRLELSLIDTKVCLRELLQRVRLLSPLTTIFIESTILHMRSLNGWMKEVERELESIDGVLLKTSKPQVSN